MSKPWFLTFTLFFQIILLANLLGALEVNCYKVGHDFITEGGMDRVDWYRAGLEAMADYANYNNWALAGLDGKDPQSATYWENFKDFSFKKPDILVLKYTLKLPLFGIVPGVAKFRIDESQLANDKLTLTMMDRPIGVEEAVLSLSATVSPTDPAAKMVRFRISLRFSPLVEALLDAKSLNAHMQLIVGSLAGNLETYSKARFDSAQLLAASPPASPGPAASPAAVPQP